MTISHQFPSHLCSASRGIKIEEAQIPLFQVSLQFSDYSSMAREFQLQGLFETETYRGRATEERCREAEE